MSREPEFQLMIRYIVAAVLAVSLPATAYAAGPWTEITVRDLEAAHRLILENHPGPVDSNNPGFAKWLDGGLAEAKEQAEAAASFRDYKRVLLAYVNGFRDGHLRVNLRVDATSVEWPGFLPRLDRDGTVRVGVSVLPEVAEGEVIVSCDGEPPSSLFEQRVAPLRWNRDIPHERAYHFPRTLLIDYGDERSRIDHCAIGDSGSDRKVDLEWRRISSAESLDRRRLAAGTTVPKLSLRRVGEVWLLSLPTFNYPSSDSVGPFRDLLREVKDNSAAIRAGTLIIDVRNNLGGISSWGEEMVAALWGPEWVRAIGSRFDNSVDWRASPSNLDHLTTLTGRLEKDGLAADAEHVRAARDAVRAALAAGEPLARQSSPADPKPLPDEPSPVTGRVFFLTDYLCASACLDFADIVLRLPGVVHIGHPTSADAIYIDNDEASLPSGLAVLSYSMKVYRYRTRRHNEWYEPAHHWPGGLMTDEAVVRWVTSLAGKAPRNPKP